jgi:hypothetical protein
VHVCVYGSYRPYAKKENKTCESPCITGREGEEKLAERIRGEEKSEKRREGRRERREEIER